eukprot:SAG31_NODE_4929_length_2855_cov_1.699057_2_plen_147_part_00
MIKVKAKLNIHSLIELDAPTVIDTYEPEPEEPPAAEAEPESQAEPEAPAETEPGAEAAAEPDSESKAEAPAAEPEPKKAKKDKTIRTTVMMELGPESLGLSNEKITSLIAAEKSMHENDVLAKRTAKAMNDLEVGLQLVTFLACMF